MMESPLVSIALCTYNGAEFLSKQITSILTQTYQHIELVIVDDGSTDATIEIIKRFQQEDPRIKLFINEVNIGYNQNFEKALGLCTGAFIAISDQDDIWLERKIETLLNSIENYDMVYANSAFIDLEDQLTGDFIIDPERKHEQFNHYKSILLQNFVTGHNMLFRKEVLEKVLPFPGHSFYDWWMGFVMLYENKLGYCDEVLTHYRTHETSVMSLIKKHSTSSKLSQLNTAFRILEHLRDFATYKELRASDKEFIRSLTHAFEDKLSSFYSFSLFGILFANFSVLFPGYHKNFLKRITFLNRYCRGIKLLNK